MKPHLIVVSPELCTEESPQSLGGRERMAGVNSGYCPLRAAYRKRSKDGKRSRSKSSISSNCSKEVID